MLVRLIKRYIHSLQETRPWYGAKIARTCFAIRAMSFSREDQCGISSTSTEFSDKSKRKISVTPDTYLRTLVTFTGKWNVRQIVVSLEENIIVIYHIVKRFICIYLFINFAKNCQEWPHRTKVPITRLLKVFKLSDEV